MAELEGVGLALQVFDALCTAAKYIQRAANDFKMAESQFATLLEDIGQCERYTTMVKRALQQIPPEAMGPKEWNSIKKQLDSILKRALNFKKWTLENMINPKDTSGRKLQKKFNVAFGKLRKIDSNLRAQVDKLREVAPEITMQLQSLVLDTVLENQQQISTLHQKIDYIVQELARLSELIGGPPGYDDAIRDTPIIEIDRSDKKEADECKEPIQTETTQQKSVPWTPMAVASAVAAAIWILA